MLPSLENIPHTENDWNHFSWDHRDSHNRIRAGIKAKFGVDLTDYQVDPIDAGNVAQFLQNNANLHSAMNGALKLQSGELQDVDLTNDKQKESWIRLHYQEHFDAENKLGV